MHLDAKPRLTGPEEVAVLRALAMARVQLNGAPTAYTSAWRRAAVDESVGSVALGTLPFVPECET